VGSITARGRRCHDKGRRESSEGHDGEGQIDERQQV
jgi:hypothetical protein